MFSLAQFGLSIQLRLGEELESEEDNDKPWLGPEWEGPKSNAKR